MQFGGKPCRAITSKRIAARAECVSPRGRCIRLWCLALVSIGWISVVVSRLVSLQITNQATWQDWAVKQHLAEVKLASERGPIYDRRGRLLAVSVPAGSIYVRPGQVRDRAATIDAVSSALKIERSLVRERLESKSPFVWIQRQVPRAAAQRVLDLKLPGVGSVIESRRYYPFNHAASAVIGKVGVDGVGLSGLEQQYERILHGEHEESIIRKDALGNLIQVVADGEQESGLPRGSSLSLTLDASLQQILDQELEQGRIEARAKSTMGVLMDAASGEVLAMGQSPAMNFNVAKITHKDQLKNLVVETIYEPGSTVKPLIAAAALDANLLRAGDVLDCGHGQMKVGRSLIRDVHPYDALSLFDVVVRSSNIGMSRVGFLFGKDRLRAVLAGFGFGQPVTLGLPGSTAGILRPASNWAHIDEATHSFGHGFAVTPLQVVRAISSIANGGVLPEPRLFVEEGAGDEMRVLSPEAAQRAREMMYAVVEDEHGTGRRAAIPGLRVGGKTGTAERVREDGRGYEEGAYVSSFVGFADGATLGVPRTLSLIVVVDRPNANSIYGGTLAAPVFQRVMDRVMHNLATEAQLHPHDATSCVADLQKVADGKKSRPLALVDPSLRS